MAAHALRLNHVLCPTDISGLSAHALSHATAIAARLGADLTVVYVCPPDVPLGSEFSYLAPLPLDPVARAELAADLDALTEPARRAGVRVLSRLLEGDPSREVAELAKELPADLLVVGLHPDSRIKHFLLGSMTEELLRHAPCPVLTVRHGVGPVPEAGAPFRRILCATDLRGTGAEVVAYALSLAEAFGAELTMLHVLERVPEFEPGSGFQFSAAEIQAFRQSLAEEARDRLRAIVPDAARERVTVRDLVKAGRAHELILRVAREEGAQLVVLGERGHGALGRLLFGSTSRRVVREAQCPVLVVRGTAGAGAELGERAEATHVVGV
jgi:nucleotide-binding universal stress UspA family protein